MHNAVGELTVWQLKENHPPFCKMWKSHFCLFLVISSCFHWPVDFVHICYPLKKDDDLICTCKYTCIVLQKEILRTSVISCRAYMCLAGGHASWLVSLPGSWVLQWQSDLQVHIHCSAERNPLWTSVIYLRAYMFLARNPLNKCNLSYSLYYMCLARIHAQWLVSLQRSYVLLLSSQSIVLARM